MRPVPRLAVFVIVLVALFGLLSCADEQPTPTPSPTAAATPTPSPEPVATNTPTPIPPTPTPLPPVSINSDCVDCPVVMPYQVSSMQQSVMAAYLEYPSASYHPEKVLLVTCSKGGQESGHGYTMGPPGRLTRGRILFVSGKLYAPIEGLCYAITAKYTGPKEACLETITGSCRFGSGEKITALGFMGVGEYTEVPSSELQIFTAYARASEYQVEE